MKSDLAFRTISEVSVEIDVPQHVLRFWESRFAQLKPLKRGGGRRYYRPEDIELLKCIKNYLYKQGYTIKGVQRLLRERGGTPVFTPPFSNIYAGASAAAMAADMPVEESNGAADLMQKSLEAVTHIHEELQSEAPVQKAARETGSRKKKMAEDDISELRAILGELTDLREVLREACPDVFEDAARQKQAG
jgi:DNA-binding transcriptional MerR regulator